MIQIINGDNLYYVVAFCFFNITDCFYISFCDDIYFHKLVGSKYSRYLGSNRSKETDSGGSDRGIKR